MEHKIAAMVLGLGIATYLLCRLAVALQARK
jgi:hypothetical protein